MKYIIEVDEKLNTVLTSNATRRNVPGPALIAEMLKRYLIDAHIMDQSELWENVINECDAFNLDWANM